MKMTEFQKNYTLKGFNPEQFVPDSNKFMKLVGNHVSKDGNNAIIRISDNHIIQTRFGYAVIMNHDTVVFIKEWQVLGRPRYSDDYVINFNREYFTLKKWGDHSANFGEKLSFENFDDVIKFARMQEEYYNTKDEDGFTQSFTF